MFHFAARMEMLPSCVQKVQITLSCKLKQLWSLFHETTTFAPFLSFVLQRVCAQKKTLKPSERSADPTCRWLMDYVQQQIGFALSLTWNQATGCLESLLGHWPRELSKKDSLFPSLANTHTGTHTHLQMHNLVRLSAFKGTTPAKCSGQMCVESAISNAWRHEVAQNKFKCWIKQGFSRNSRTTSNIASCCTTAAFPYGFSAEQECSFC